MPLLRDDATGRFYVNWPVVEKGLLGAGLIKPPPGLLSTGEPATLGNYLKMAQLFFGKDCKAAKFLEQKIGESENGADEEVIADERQMVFLLMHINEGGKINEHQANPFGSGEKGPD
jgi:hypothetical protein